MTRHHFFLLCFNFFSHGNSLDIYRGNISIGKIPRKFTDGNIPSVFPFVFINFLVVVLLSGQSRDDLYILSELSAMSLPQVFSSTCLSTSTNVWHRRLRHPSPCIFHFLASTKQVSCMSKQFNFNCSACPLEKSSRLTLKTTGHQTQAPLDLIFSDVWGLSPMLSSDSFRYFVILWMPIQNLFGFILWFQNLMCLLYFINFRRLLSANFL